MSYEGQIQVTISPDRIPAGTAEFIAIRLTNTGQGACTNINFSVRSQPGLIVVGGSTKMSREILAAGESFGSSLKVQASRAGNYRLSSPGFSYDDHLGNAHNVRNFTADIIVESEPQPAAGPEISVKLVSERLVR